MNALWLILLCLAFLGASSINSLVSLFQKLENYRWGHFFHSLAPDRISAVPFDEADSNLELIVLTGWPLAKINIVLHLYGSPLENFSDPDLINSHLDQLFDLSFRALTAFSVLDGWASEEFLIELEKRGYVATVHPTIMTLEDLSPLIEDPVQNLPNEIEVCLIENLEDFEGLITHLDLGPFQHLYRGFDLAAIRDPQMHSWGAFDKRTGECVGTTQVFLHDPTTAIIGLVSTSEKWRQRGIATYLVSKGLHHALGNSTIQRAMLLSSAMAKSMYQRMGFEAIATITTYEYSLPAQLSNSCTIF